VSSAAGSFPNPEPRQAQSRFTMDTVLSPIWEAEWLLPGDVCQSRGGAVKEAAITIGGGDSRSTCSPGGELLIGAIAIVDVDHMEVNGVDGRQIYVPNSLVLAVIRSTVTH